MSSKSRAGGSKKNQKSDINTIVDKLSREVRQLSIANVPKMRVSVAIDPTPSSRTPSNVGGCSCRGNCSTKRCGCNKNGMSCSTACKCHGCAN